MPDDKPDDAEVLEPDPAPPPQQAKRSDRRRDDDDRDDDRDDDHDDDHDDRDDRDDRDDDYHPRGRRAKYDEDGYEITSEFMMWAMFAHLGVLLLGFLAPLIILIAFRQKSPFVVRHARECLNHLLTVLMLNVLALGVGAAIGFGVYLATQEPLVSLIVGELVAVLPSMVIGIANIVFLILAGIAAGKGNDYRYPFTLRLIG